MVVVERIVCDIAVEVVNLEPERRRRAGGLARLGVSARVAVTAHDPVAQPRIVRRRRGRVAIGPDQALAALAFGD
jgi:hypothetical protein